MLDSWNCTAAFLSHNDTCSLVQNLGSDGLEERQFDWSGGERNWLVRGDWLGGRGSEWLGGRGFDWLGGRGFDRLEEREFDWLGEREFDLLEERGFDWLGEKVRGERI